MALELLRKGFEVIPQWEVAGKRIDLVVEGGRARLAVECYGDHWHGADQYEADMDRQRRLERSGWEFFTVRESAFYLDKEGSLCALWRLLEERGIKPDWATTASISAEPEDELECEDTHEEEAEDKREDNLFSPENGDSPTRRVEEVSPSNIQTAIVDALQKCPNHSCTLDSLTTRVLRELGVRTRGKPRAEFEKRVMHSLDVLERKDLIEKYKSKNKRVRLSRN